MTERDPEAFTRKYWPPLLIACCLLVLWYTIGGNVFAGAAGFLGLASFNWRAFLETEAEATRRSLLA